MAYAIFQIFDLDQFGLHQELNNDTKHLLQLLESKKHNSNEFQIQIWLTYDIGQICQL
jgi:hypothetical protein